MLTRRPLPLLAAVVACLAACTQGPKLATIEPLTDLMDLGRERYAQSCAPCHGADGRGDGPVAGELRHPPTDLTLLAAANHGVFPRDAFVDAVTGDRAIPAHGTREMPIWKTRFGPTGSGATAAASFYAQRRLDALVKYVGSLQRPAP